MMQMMPLLMMMRINAGMLNRRQEEIKLAAS
jgi:hypothetical protein